MQCQSVQEMLSKYLAGECSDLEKLMLERHLAACPDCASELKEIRQLDSLLSSWQPDKAPPDLWGAVMGQIENVKTEERISSRPNNNRAQGNTARALLRDLLVAAAASLILWWNTGNLFNEGQMIYTGKNVSQALSAYTRVTSSAFDKATGVTGEYTRKIFFGISER